MSNIHALLPSAGRLTSPASDAKATEWKALLEVGGRTLLETAIVALRESELVEKIVVIGPREVLQHPATKLADSAIEDGGAGASGPDNIFLGLQTLPPEAQRALVVTTDLPFLDGKSVRAFIEACPAEREVCVSVCKRAPFEARFPDAGGEWVRLRDGEWTVGGLYLLDVSAMKRAHPHIERLFQSRKSQLQMARLLGPLFIVRFATKRLATSHILERCQQILGCSGAAVECAPELAFDIDTPEEWLSATKAAAT